MKKGVITKHVLQTSNYMDYDCALYKAISQQFPELKVDTVRGTCVTLKDGTFIQIENGLGQEIADRCWSYGSPSEKPAENIHFVIDIENKEIKLC